MALKALPGDRGCIEGAVFCIEVAVFYFGVAFRILMRPFSNRKCPTISIKCEGYRAFP